MTTALNPHGQPLSLGFNAARRRERDISEILGLVKGILSDGTVADGEAAFLRSWCEAHPDARDLWPVNVLLSRLERCFADGRIDDDERIELRDLFSDLVGGTQSVLLGYDGASALPLDKPTPLICYGPDEVFTFTGKFAYGTRKQCEREVMQRGSTCAPNVTRRTSFLVIGTFGSRDWVQTAYGRKIQRAVELRDSGFALRIVGEDHWVNALPPSR